MQKIGFKGAIVTSEPSCKNHILNSYYKDRKSQKSRDENWRDNRGNLACKTPPAVHKYSDNCSFYLNPADNFNPPSGKELPLKLYLWNKDYHTFNKFLARNAKKIPADIDGGKYGSRKLSSDVEKYMIKASKLAAALVETGKITEIKNRDDVGAFVNKKGNLKKNVLNEDILNKALATIAVEPQKVEAEPAVISSVPVAEKTTPLTMKEKLEEAQKTSEPENKDLVPEEVTTEQLKPAKTNPGRVRRVPYDPDKHKHKR